MSYAGLVLQDPSMFPGNEVNGKPLTPLVLLPSLLKLSATPSSAFSSGTSTGLERTGGVALEPFEVPIFLGELAKRFGDGEGLDDILGPVFSEITRLIRDGEGNAASQAATPSTSAPAPNINSAAAAGDVQAVLAALLGQAGAAGMPGAGAAPGGASGALGALGMGAQRREGMNIAGFEWRPYVMAVVEACDNKQIAQTVSSAQLCSQFHLYVC